MLITSQPSVSQLSGKGGSLDVSQPYGSPWPVTGRAFILPYNKELQIEDIYVGRL
jgi:hypothetical protein